MARIQIRTETFEKKNAMRKDRTFIRRLVHEEEVELTDVEIERMEKNALAEIERANQLISDMNDKLAECARLRTELSAV